MKKRITIQGVAGCFHEAAAKEYFSNEDIETIPCETFPILFDTLKYDEDDKEFPIKSLKYKLNFKK